MVNSQHKILNFALSTLGEHPSSLIQGPIYTSPVGAQPRLACQPGSTQSCSLCCPSAGSMASSNIHKEKPCLGLWSSAKVEYFIVCLEDYKSEMDNTNGDFFSDAIGAVFSHMQTYGD